MRTVVCLLLAYFFAMCSAQAHPVAQGTMHITLDRTGVSIRALVANEQVFVAEAHARLAPARNAAELWPRHGDYLLQRIHVRAGASPLLGHLVMVQAPANPGGEGRTGYEFRFAFPVGVTEPVELVFTQDVLNEIEFVPGNRWEATYLTKLTHPGGLVEEGVLFTSRAPLVMRAQWNTQHTSAAAGSAAPKVRSHLFPSYLVHGFMHIVTGYDHLMFVSALVLAAMRFADLLKVVTAFTLAHTVTLALSVLNVVRLPSTVVEPVIAGSIVVVAMQNIISPRSSRGWTRLLLAFAFGLFHGLGYAGGLIETMEGLPGASLAVALGSFSVGVELGHAAVVVPLFALLHFSNGRERMSSTPGPMLVERWASAVICCAGLVYFAAALR